MRIVVARRLSQGFFLVLFLWFCLVATVGGAWWQLRGWPINWILSLDPLTALTTALATGRLYAPLLWAVAVVALTALVGRFFCGFVCPLGTLNHMLGWLARRSRSRAQRVADNRHHPAQGLKYLLLVFLLVCAAMGSVQSGVFDPLPLLHRSVNLVLAPLADPGRGLLHDAPRFYAGAWLLGTVFLAILGLNLVAPRFFCRFLCPLGAFHGLTARFAPWRMGKADADSCGDCQLCEEYCEGGCRPSQTLVHGECLLCANCLDRCPNGRMGFRTQSSAMGEVPLPDVSRRSALVAGLAGLLAAPLWRVGGLSSTGRNAGLIRPPGALDEERFLARCIRCGQCMRACPSNMLQPTLWEAGLQGLWTPAANYRLGRSGCQMNCVACGHVCPTAAIRPLSLDEKRGLGPFASAGPLRMGTAFVDRSRCLPWVMDRPCIVCQELCPVSPKAIFTRTVHEPLRDGRVQLARVHGDTVELAAPLATTASLASGDCLLRPADGSEAPLRRIVAAVGTPVQGLTLEPGAGADFQSGGQADILVRLQRPHVDAARCIGCGMCEHECPVSGLRAIRVYAENESRSGPGRMLLEGGKGGRP